MTDESNNRISRNKSEDDLFKKQLDKYFGGTILSHEVITVCGTPNILKLQNSTAKKIILSQRDLANAVSDAESVRHHTEGHNIDQEEIYNLSQALRSPIMVLKGKNRNVNSVVLVTELINKEGENVFVPISLDRQNGKVSSIASLYGKKNLSDFLKRNIENILAINIEKAYLLADTENQYLQSISETVVRFDNSIAYTLDNVKYPEKEILSHNGIGQETKDAAHYEKHAEEERIFKLTDQPVSKEMQAVIEHLLNKEFVPMSVIKNVPEIKLAYSILNESGKRTKIDLKSREPLRMSIYDKMLNIGSAVVDENGKVQYNGDVAKEARLDIIIGLPASGKSSTLVDPISTEYQSRLIDNDEAKKLFPEFNDGWGSAVVHEESQNICDKIFLHSILKGENIVLPKVGSNAEKLIAQYIDKAKSVGYKVYVHFADLDRNKAQGRMLSRFCETGRFLPLELIDKYAPVINGRTENHIESSYQFLKDSGLVDGFSKWDNDVNMGEKPILLENIGCEGRFIDIARVEREEENNGHGEFYGSGFTNVSGNGGQERYSNVVHNPKLGENSEIAGRKEESSDRQAVRQLSDAGIDGTVGGRGAAPVITFNDLKDSLKARSGKKQEETEVSVQKTINRKNDNIERN